MSFATKLIASKSDARYSVWLKGVDVGVGWVAGPPATHHRRTKPWALGGPSTHPTICIERTPHGASTAIGSTPSRNPVSARDRYGLCSFRTAFDSICRTRSRVTEKIFPTSSSV